MNDGRSQAGRGMKSDSMPTPDRAGRLALAAALLLFMALALFGQRVHWVEEAGTAERDGYVTQAENILAGTLPRDPFRPLLYPLLTAGLTFVVGSPFAAARLISNLAAAILAGECWAFGRRLGGSAVGAWAMALAAVNPNLWILGQHVSTDMLFGALAAGALLAGFAYLQAPRTGSALVAGLLLGLAAFTRSNAIFLIPALLVAWWLTPRHPENQRRRVGHLAGAAVVACLVLIPHWGLRQSVFGNPFHDENWKNLAWKLHGYPDWSYLNRVPYSGLLDVVLDGPAAVLKGGLSELVRFLFGFHGGLAQLLGTWAHTMFFFSGLWFAVRAKPREAGWLVFAWVSFLVAVAFSFFAWGRLLLVLIPPAYGLTFTLLTWSPPRGWDRRLATLMALGLAALVGLLAVKTFAFRLPAFVDRHPYREVAVLQALDDSLPTGPALAGTSPFLGRYLGRRYLALPDAFGPEIEDPRLYYQKIEPLLRRSGTAYVVAGQVDLRDRPASLIESKAPVPWLQWVSKEDGVTVWRILPAQRPPSPGGGRMGDGRGGQGVRTHSTANGPQIPK